MDALGKKTLKKKIRWSIWMFLATVIYFAALTPENNDGHYYGFVVIFIVYVAGWFYISLHVDKERICPKCGKPTGKRIKKTIIEDCTWDTEGHGIYLFRCTKCGHEWEEPFTIMSGRDERERASSDDSSSSGGSSGGFGGRSSGGSWGGGRSSGGGAGRSF